MLTLEQIQKELATETSPTTLAEYRVLLSHKYGEATDKLEKILIEKPAIWNSMRRDHKSDTATERSWEATELGVEERHWRFQIKKIEKMMSSIKSLIDARNTEYFNQSGA